MKHFIVGPVEMYPSTKNILEKGYTYFRTEEYGNLTKKCLNKLSEMLGNSLENSLIYLAASGTGAMEAVVDNCMLKTDKALVINGGSFGHRFEELLNWHGIPNESINLSWDEVVTAQHLEPFRNKGFNALFVNLDETSSGKLYDIALLSNFCKENNMYLIVDAISAFLADDYNMDKYGIDVTILSSQKGLCLSAGMSFVSFSKKMKERILNNPDPSSYYFNFKDYFKNIERGQTPFTPPVSTMYELNEIINLIETSGGKDAWVKNIEEKANYFREKAAKLGLKIPSYPKSNTLTPIYFEDIDASLIVKMLREKYQIFINPCGGALAKKLLRVSHIGNTTITDIDDLLEKMELVINEIKVAV